jgi:hypothetical protein
MHLHDTPPVGYEDDYVVWLGRQMQLLRSHRFDLIDLAQVVEELEGLVAHERHELSSRIYVILAHLVKCRYQPTHKGKSWLSTLDEQRFRVRLVLEDSPSLRPSLPAVLARVWPAARRKALREMNYGPNAVPEELMFTLDEVLDDSFVP